MLDCIMYWYCEIYLGNMVQYLPMVTFTFRFILPDHLPTVVSDQSYTGEQIDYRVVLVAVVPGHIVFPIMVDLHMDPWQRISQSMLLIFFNLNRCLGCNFRAGFFYPILVLLGIAYKDLQV